MAFENSSFNLWLNASLVSAFGGIYTLVHKTDLSDNPQDFTLYLGSLLSGRQLQASSSPGVANITLTPVDLLQRWSSATSYTAGDKVQPLTSNGFVYRCTVTGVSGGTEPVWPVVTIGTTVVDNTTTWELYSAHHNITEIKLALSSVGLASATAGAALNIGATILGGVASALPIYIRVTNAVTGVSNSTGFEEIGVSISALVETAVS